MKNQSVQINFIRISKEAIIRMRLDQPACSDMELSANSVSDALPIVFRHTTVRPMQRTDARTAGREVCIVGGWRRVSGMEALAFSKRFHKSDRRRRQGKSREASFQNRGGSSIFDLELFNRLLSKP